MKKVVIHDEDNPEKIQTEGKILQQLSHPNIIKLHESYMKDDKFYMILEYWKNGDLSKKVKKMNQGNLYFTDQEVISNTACFGDKVPA